MKKPKVLILMGSDSDLSVMEDGLAFLRNMDVSYKVIFPRRTVILIKQYNTQRRPGKKGLK